MTTLERGYFRRKWFNRVMLGLCSAAAGIAILMLAIILGYTLAHGISALNLNFLTQAAKPVGEAGGGMRNEIIGTFILILLGSVIALPVGLVRRHFSVGIRQADASPPRCALQRIFWPASLR